VSPLPKPPNTPGRADAWVLSPRISRHVASWFRPVACLKQPELSPLERDLGGASPKVPWTYK
jgi:hypothetical protein